MDGPRSYQLPMICLKNKSSLFLSFCAIKYSNGVEIVPDICINLQDDSAESMVRFPSSSLDVLLEIEWWYHFQGGSGCSQIFCF